MFGGRYIEELLIDPILNDENFSRSIAQINNYSIVDLNERSSWTHNQKFTINSLEVNDYFEKNFILMIIKNFNY